jgi:dCMP deaminase
MSAGWDAHFLKLASVTAERSKDRSSRIGCVIVGPDNEIRSTGYNGMPRGLNDNVESRHERPEKYLWFEHAERNAIYNAARMGTALKGCRAYVSMMLPCMDCARALIQSGIQEVIHDDPKDAPPDMAERWSEHMTKSRVMLFEAGLRVRAPKQSLKFEPMGRP